MPKNTPKIVFRELIAEVLALSSHGKTRALKSFVQIKIIMRVSTKIKWGGFKMQKHLFGNRFLGPFDRNKQKGYFHI